MTRLGCIMAAICCAATGLVCPDARTDDSGSGIGAAIGDGSATLSSRYRYEFVDDDRFEDDANASTLMLRLNYETAAYEGWSGFVEFDHIFEVLLKDFNSGAGTSGSDRDRFPVVADPNGPDLNQFFIQYAPDDELTVRLGRQRIVLDDRRFIGGVVWRQNEQTYDALSVRYEGWEDLDVFYSYVANVARIFGSGVDAGNHKQDSHFLNVSAAIKDDLKLFAYAYLIDNSDVPTFSTNTLGVRAEGSMPAGAGNLSWLAEWARQTDAANNPAGFDTDYYRVRATWKPGKLSTGVGFEVLGTDDGESFRTPLATLYAFNGWADQFLTTPADGLRDLYVSVGAKAGDWSLGAIYHDFSADRGGDRYGSELDLTAGRDLSQHHSLLIRAARFSADDASFSDVTKFWLMLTSRF